MLDTTQKGIAVLIRNALLDEKNSLPDTADFGAIVSLAKRHGVLNMTYYGALNAGISNEDELMQGLFIYSCKIVAKSTQQLYELDCIFDAFQKNGINYMPLKGTVLKKLYPKSDMRPMGDADILIKPEQYEKIIPIVSALGFESGGESDHELIWKKKSLFLELHKHLIPSYFKDYYAYFGDGWGKAHLTEKSTCRYEMSQEDTFIYLFSHFAKHYRDGGIGIKHLTDIYIYRKKYPQMDDEYIKYELEKLKLNEFYQNILVALECLFESEEFDEKSAFIFKVILNSGAFGTAEAMSLSKAVKASKTAGSAKGGRARRLRQIFFPSVEVMRKRYPILNKLPVLLPFMWFSRGLETVFFKKQKLKENMATMKNITADKIDSYQQSLLYVGLDYNFKE